MALLLVLHSVAGSFFSYEDEGEETAPPAPPTHDDAASSGTSLLVVGLVLAFLSQISMVGKGLQKEAVGGLPALALTKDVLTQYVTSLPWVRGVGVDVAGDGSSGNGAKPVVHPAPSPRPGSGRHGLAPPNTPIAHRMFAPLR